MAMFREIYNFSHLIKKFELEVIVIKTDEQILK